MELKRAGVGDLDMAFVDQGTGPVVLLVHGFPLSHAMWQFQIDALADTYRVIAPDLRGCGESRAEFDEGNSPHVLSMETHAADLAALLDVLGIDGPVTFCGLSMGGYIAWQFLRQFRERVGALILCDTRSAPDSEDAREQRYVMADRVLLFGSTIAASAMIPKMFSRDVIQRNVPVVDATRNVIAATDPMAIAAALRGMAGREGAEDLLRSIDVPTLLVCGEHDEISTPEEMRGIADRIEGAELVVVPDAGHMSPLENPAAVNEAMATFLAN